MRTIKKDKPFYKADSEHLIDNQPTIEQTIAYVERLYVTDVPGGELRFQHRLDKSGILEVYHPHKINKLIPVPEYEGKTDEDYRKFLEKSKEYKDMKLVALLHDVVEDGLVSFEELEKRGYSEKVIKSLKLLTKEPNTEGLSQEEKNAKYLEYIKNLIDSGDKIAIAVKFLDMIDNLSTRRMLKLSPEERQKRFDKYAEPMKLLKEEFCKIIPEEELTLAAKNEVKRGLKTIEIKELC